MKKTDKQITQGSGNVFLDLGFPPHQATVMLLRCELAEGLRRWMVRRGLTQAQAAEHLGVSQPRISEISRNKVDKLSLDYLVGLCSKAGVSVKVKLAHDRLAEHGSLSGPHPRFGLSDGTKSDFSARIEGLRQQAAHGRVVT